MRHDEERATATASGFWNVAKLHIPYLSECDGHQILRSLLLLAHFGLLNPSAVNVWTCSGAALSVALQLGLHNENITSQQAPMSVYDQEQRRKLFWATYILNG